jgi:hypothetical protein
MSEELKTCPFCGKPAEHVYINGFKNEAYIICSDHNCLGHMSISWGTQDDYKKFVQTLINNWNRRAQPDNPPLSLIELESPDNLKYGIPVFIMPTKDYKGEWGGGWYIYPYDAHDFKAEDYAKTWLAYAHRKDGDEG